MGKNNILTKILAVIGTALVLFPVLSPFLFMIVAWIRIQRFRFDWLMPAELVLSALVGGVFLIFAALGSRSHLRWIGWSLGIAVGILLLGQGLAVLTGLASGENETPFFMAMLAATVAIYTLSLFVMGISGIRLLVRLFKPSLS